MKKVIIVHRWDGTPENDWYPWLKKELENKGFQVIVPEMPNTSEPKIEEWIAHLKKAIGKVDIDTHFIGHSIGCQTIMRYLATLPKKTKVGNVIFVAGWFNLNNLENEEVKKIAKPWLETPIYFIKVKQKIGMLTVFLSDNDPYNCLEENVQTFKEKLGAKVVILNNRGHFTHDDGVLKMPKILDELISIS